MQHGACQTASQNKFRVISATIALLCWPDSRRCRPQPHGSPVPLSRPKTHGAAERKLQLLVGDPAVCASALRAVRFQVASYSQRWRFKRPAAARGARLALLHAADSTLPLPVVLAPKSPWRCSQGPSSFRRPAPRSYASGMCGEASLRVHAGILRVAALVITCTRMACVLPTAGASSTSSCSRKLAGKQMGMHYSLGQTACKCKQQLQLTPGTGSCTLQTACGACQHARCCLAPQHGEGTFMQAQRPTT